jgi:hypothetical protein
MLGSQLIRQVVAVSKSLFKMLRRIWGGSTHRRSADVQPDEELTSYVFREDQIVRVTNTIHHSRLMPRRKQKNERLEVSVCRSSKLTEA